MKLMTCPINGPRAISEFACGGELRQPPDPNAVDDRAWADYVFNRSSLPGPAFRQSAEARAACQADGF